MRIINYPPQLRLFLIHKEVYVIVEKAKGNSSTIEEYIVKFVVDDNEIPKVWTDIRWII